MMKPETGFGCYFCREAIPRVEVVEIETADEIRFACPECAAERVAGAKPVPAGEKQVA